MLCKDISSKVSLSTEGVLRTLRVMDESPFLTIPEVASSLRVSLTRAYRMAADGVFPAIRLSEGRIRVPRSAFDAWLHEQETKALANVREPAAATR